MAIAPAFQPNCSIANSCPFGNPRENCSGSTFISIEEISLVAGSTVRRKPVLSFVEFDDQRRALGLRIGNLRVVEPERLVACRRTERCRRPDPLQSEDSVKQTWALPAGPPKIMAPIGPSRNASIPSVFGAGVAV